MRILFFSHLKDSVNCSEVEWPDATSLNAEEFWNRLLREFPQLAPHQNSVRLARNGIYAVKGERFQQGDEVALIPPVSGG